MHIGVPDDGDIFRNPHSEFGERPNRADSHEVVGDEQRIEGRFLTKPLRDRLGAPINGVLAVFKWPWVVFCDGAGTTETFESVGKHYVGRVATEVSHLFAPGSNEVLCGELSTGLVISQDGVVKRVSCVAAKEYGRKGL